MHACPCEKVSELTFNEQQWQMEWQNDCEYFPLLPNPHSSLVQEAKSIYTYTLVIYQVKCSNLFRDGSLTQNGNIMSIATFLFIWRSLNHA